MLHDPLVHWNHSDLYLSCPVTPWQKMKSPPMDLVKPTDATRALLLQTGRNILDDVVEIYDLV